ncbi:MAG: signal peptidase II [Bacteroidia bacterium]|nr:signal peptidase II [Bacteroidia bacterium]
MLKNLRILYVTAGLLILDQVTKLLVKGVNIPSLGISHYGMTYGESIQLIGDWLKITYIENPNMAFGIEVGGKLFLTIFAMLASVAIVYLLWKYRSERTAFRLSLALVLSGALGNLIDRTLYPVLYGTGSFFEGNVVDFINFDLFMINLGSSSFKFWPIFNVADAAVSIGVVLLLIVGFPHKAADADAAVHAQRNTTPDSQ